MARIKSFQYSIFIILLIFHSSSAGFLRINETAHPELTYRQPNQFISDYMCDSNSGRITFICSNIAERDISQEILSAGQLTRCKDWSVSLNTIDRVKFLNCEFIALPYRLLQMKQVLELDLSSMALNVLNMKDFQSIKWYGDFIPSLQTLNLSSNHLVEVNQPVFSAKGMLVVLDLSNNLLQTLNADAFVGLTDLRRMYLQRNKFIEIAEGTFMHLSGLQRLDLSYNQIDQLYADSFRNLTILQTLNLEGNLLYDIPAATFTGFYDTRTLDLSHNQFRVLKSTFVGDVDFKGLDLSFNSIGVLKAGDFMYLQRVERLDLSNTELSSIEFGSMSPLTSLRSLDLSNNRLKSIDFDLFLPSFPHLESLYLSGNQLTELSNRFDRLFPSLQSLVITNNQFNCSYVKAFLLTLNKNHHAVLANPASHLANVGRVTCALVDDIELKTDNLFEAQQSDIHTDELLQSILNALETQSNATIRTEEKITRNASNTGMVILLLAHILGTMLVLLTVVLYNIRRNLFQYRSVDRNDFDRFMTPMT